MTPRNLHMEWAALLVDGLASAGVTDVVVSPGSRSTPFVLAAERDPRLRVLTVLDERCAAFFALGQARVTGRPSLLICTSGTAGAHYLPAIIEASESRTPLVALTADRPPELHRVAAHQATDQARLFGTHARASIELGAPEARTESLRAVRHAAAQAVFRAVHPDPGPVHLNGWLRKPLEPERADSEADRELAKRAAALRAEPAARAIRPRLVPDDDAMAELVDACRSATRGLIVCGPAPVAAGSTRAAIERVAELTRFPILAEATSQMRFRRRAADVDGGASRPAPETTAPRLDAFDAVFRAASFRERHAPELIIQLGAPPTSEGWRRYLDTWPGTRRFIIAPHGWPDPEHTAGRMLAADPGDVFHALAGTLAAHPRRDTTPWETSLTGADAVSWSAVDEELESARDALTGGEVVRGVVERVPPASLLSIGNSLPIRDIDTFCPGSIAAAAVMSQWGVRGIDGMVSGAAGAATRWNNPVTLLLGDASMLHDIGGLLTPQSTGWPLVIVIASNRGGRIFEELPIASSEDLAGFVRDRMVAPHDIDFAHAAALYRHEYRRVTSGKALRSVLMEAYTVPFCTIVEAVIPPHTVAAQHARLRAAIEARLR